MDQETLDIISVVEPFTKSTQARLTYLISALRSLDARGVEGDVVECGVWRGGSVILARKVSPDRICWLYDTFQGMTKPDPMIDYNYKGQAAMLSYEAKQRMGIKWQGVSQDDVQANFVKTGTFNKTKLRFVAGPVEETLVETVPDRIALLRLDTDWYRSTAFELARLYPRLVKGGCLIIDDYGHWVGAKKAADDYFGRDFVWEKVDYTAVAMIKQ